MFFCHDWYWWYLSTHTYHIFFFFFFSSLSLSYVPFIIIYILTDDHRPWSPLHQSQTLNPWLKVSNLSLWITSKLRSSNLWTQFIHTLSHPKPSLHILFSTLISAHQTSNSKNRSHLSWSWNLLNQNLKSTLNLDSFDELRSTPSESDEVTLDFNHGSHPLLIFIPHISTCPFLYLFFQSTEHTGLKFRNPLCYGKSSFLTLKETKGLLNDQF